MGMNYRLIPKNKAIHKMLYNAKIETLLERPTNAFIVGKTASGKDSEYNQLEKLFDIDLSPFQVFNTHGYHLFTENVEGEMDWRLYNAKTEEGKNQIKNQVL